MAVSLVKPVNYSKRVPAVNYSHPRRTWQAPIVSYRRAEPRVEAVRPSGVEYSIEF